MIRLRRLTHWLIFFTARFAGAAFGNDDLWTLFDEIESLETDMCREARVLEISCELSLCEGSVLFMLI